VGLCWRYCSTTPTLRPAPTRRQITNLPISRTLPEIDIRLTPGRSAGHSTTAKIGSRDIEAACRPGWRRLRTAVVGPRRLKLDVTVLWLWPSASNVMLNMLGQVAVNGSIGLQSEASSWRLPPSGRLADDRSIYSVRGSGGSVAWQWRVGSMGTDGECVSLPAQYRDSRKQTSL